MIIFYLDEYYEKDESSFEKCGCVSPCEEDTFQVFLSSASFPAEYMLDRLKGYIPNKTEKYYR